MYVTNALYIGNCTDGSVKLVGGNDTMSGRVEVCHNSIWGTVCGDGFTDIEPTVICNQLGHKC